MKKFVIEADIVVFGHEVTSFPEGIKEAYDALVDKVPGGFTRSFYGISKMAPGGGRQYYATAVEIDGDEAETLGYERFRIPKGEYIYQALESWRGKLDDIKKVFHDLMADPSVDKSSPAVEWYKNENEMFCMLKLKAG